MKKLSSLHVCQSVVTLLMLLLLSPSSYSQTSLNSLKLDIEQSERVRSVLEQGFPTFSKQNKVTLKSLDCRAQTRDDGFSNYVCTLKRSSHDAAIFGGQEAATLFLSFLESGAARLKSKGSFTVSIQNLECTRSGFYSDGSFEHSCTAATRLRSLASQ